MRAIHSQYDPSIFRFLREREIPLHFAENLPLEFVDESSKCLLKLLNQEARVQLLPSNCSFSKIVEAHSQQWA
jgi:hypothetical protein